MSRYRSLDTAGSHPATIRAASLCKLLSQSLWVFGWSVVVFYRIQSRIENRKNRHFRYRDRSSTTPRKRSVPVFVPKSSIAFGFRHCFRATVIRTTFCFLGEMATHAMVSAVVRCLFWGALYTGIGVLLQHLRWVNRFFLSRKASPRAFRPL